MPRTMSSQQQVGCTACQPGAIETAIWSKARSFAENAFAKYPSRAFEAYGALLDKMATLLCDMSGIPADAVAEVVRDVQSVERPKASYSVGRDATIRRWLKRLTTYLRDRLMLKQIPKYGPDNVHVGPVSHRVVRDSDMEPPRLNALDSSPPTNEL